jgi:hypothetical protein
MDGGGNATSFVIYDEPALLVNMSVWTDRQALLDFVYSDTHRALLRRRREFFARMTEAVTVLWWVPAGHLPTVAEAQRRLDHLRAHGPSSHAFRLSDGDYPAPGTAALEAALATESE